MSSVWNSNLPRQIKLSFFYATVESVLLYGSECWTLKPTLEKSLDGCYTRMLRAVLNISKSAHVTNRILYEGIPRVSEKIAVRRMRLAGHCHRHRELPASKLVLWEPTHVWASVKRTSHTNIRGHTQEGCRSPEYQGNGQMYGEPGWLEATMEGSSEDDLEWASPQSSVGILNFLFLPCYVNKSFKTQHGRIPIDPPILAVIGCTSFHSK